MIRKILTVPDPILKQKALPAEPDRVLRKSLIDTLAPLENAVGLAAPQIGVSRRMFALKDEEDEVTVYRNPKITMASVITEMDVEACLSIPMEYYKVHRSVDIEMEHDKGKLKASGDLARSIQHEIDHLNGILISDIGERIIPFDSNRKD